jgi:hypothetical protein
VSSQYEVSFIAASSASAASLRAASLVSPS